jgi:ribose/xylose/arabinose/galactoside ABC-type transport system permease subunit
MPLASRPTDAASEAQRSRLRLGLGVNPGVVAGLLLLVGVLWVTTPTFRSVQNVQNVAQQVSINAIIAVGMTFVIIAGGIDLSVGSVLGLVGTVTALTLTAPSIVSRLGTGAVAAAIAAGLTAGAAVGLLNGAAVAWLRMQAFIVTLATMWATRGAANLLTNGSPVGIVSADEPFAAARNHLLDRFTFLGMGYVGPPRAQAPVSALIALAAVVAGSVVLDRTAFGRHVRAVGGNEEAARLSAVPVARVKLAVYGISGALAGVAGIVLMSKLVSGQPTAGQGYELNAIAAVVVGGTSLRGGAGSVVGTLVGALIITVINNGLDLNGVSSFWQLIVTGGLIFAAVLLDEVTRRRS